MLLLFFILFAVVFSTTALDLNQLYLAEELANYPSLAKCRPSLRMIDSSGKIPHSILKGNLIEFGNFEECLAIEEYNNKTEHTTVGKYCLMKLKLPLKDMISRSSSTSSIQQKDLNITLPEKERTIIHFMFEDRGLGIVSGWCLPQECPVRELTKTINYILGKLSEDEDSKIKLFPGFCQTKEDLVINYTTNDILIIIFFAITLLLITLSTIYDMYIGYCKKDAAHILLLAFSIKSNGKKLLATSNHPDQLSCLHGIRFISMMWVMYAHRYQTFAAGPLINMTESQDWADKPINQYIINAGLSVDSFFVLSGILVSYVFCNAMDKGVKFNIVQYYIHRYLRLTPVLAVIIWLHSTVLIYIGSGPLLMTNNFLKAFFDDYWWSTLLYIQNYYNPQELCISQSWYLAVDMQLYILSPLLLVPLWKWPKQTMTACSGLLLAAMAIPFSISYVEEFLSITTNSGNSEFMRKMYFPVYTRYGPWLIGLMLGYFLFTLKKNKNKKINLSLLQILLGWIGGLGLLLSSLFSGYVLMNKHDNLGNAFFNAGSRHGWAFGLSWVIFACTQGYGGPINDFLSWSVFQVLSRFTYTMYLTHLSIMYILVCSSKTGVYFSDFQVMYIFWGDLMLTLAVSVCFTLAYESPMMTIEKVMFGKHKQKKTILPPPITSVEDGQRNEAFNKEEQ